jgi:hypothetical protein
VLSDRFGHADVMAREAQIYYDNLTATISMDDRVEWEKEVQEAESQRQLDPSAMDILRTRSGFAGSGPGPGPGPGPSADADETQGGAASPGARWVQLGLVIEERQ